MTPIRCALVSCLLILTTALQAGERQVFHLHLQGAGGRNSPMVLTIEAQGQDLIAAVITEPYRSQNHPTAPQVVKTDGFRWAEGRLFGPVQVASSTITINARINQAMISGDYGLEDENGLREGRIIGTLLPLPPRDHATHLTVYLRQPYPGRPTFCRRPQHILGVLALQLRDGAVVAGRFESTRPSSTDFGRGLPVVTDVAVAGGRIARLSFTPTDRMSWQQTEGDWRTGSLQTLVLTDNGHRVTYHLDYHIIGDTIFGEYRLEGEGVEPNHRNAVIGYWGHAAHLIPERPEITNADRGVAELHHHLLWLFDNPYAGSLFASDHALTSTFDTGNKQYDNPPMVGGSGVISMLLLARLSDDPLISAQATMAAVRAGHYLYSRRSGRLNLLPTYKGMFWMHFWMGRAYLDLYAATNDPFWRERAIELAEALRQTQTPEGSWNWVDSESGQTGVSNSRHDRSWDNIPLQCGDWLYFLGQLRQAGIGEFVDVERRAAAWMRQAVEQGVVHNDRDYLWRGRAPSSRLQAIGPTFYSLYLLKYAEHFDPEHLGTVLEFIENNLWQVGEDRLPYIDTDFSRSPPGTTSVATMRTAFVYLLAAERTANADYRRRAGQLFTTVLSSYDAQSGLIWNAQVPADWTAYATMMRHPYTVFQSDLAYQLQRFITLGSRAATDDHPIPLPQSITFDPLANVTAQPARIALTATASSGLPVDYTIDSGPATLVEGHLHLSGETGIVFVTAHQPGNDRFIPALTVQQSFAVGDASPPAATNLTADPLDVHTVRLRWQPSRGEHVVAYHIETSRDAGKTWQQAGQVDADTSTFEAGDHQPGESRHYRIIAANPHLRSEPSPMVAIASHALPLRVELYAALAQAGDQWEMQEFGDIPGDKTTTALVAVDNIQRGTVTEPYQFTFHFDIGDQSGRYRVWYMCWGNSGSNDSAWFRVNDQPFQVIPITNAGQWQWRSVDAELSQPGRHSITFGARQSTTARGTPAPRIAYAIVTNAPLQQE